MQILGRMRIQVPWEDSTKGRHTWPIFQSGRSRSAVGAYAGVITCFRLLIANCARIWCSRHVRVPSGALCRCCLDLEPTSWQDPRQQPGRRLQWRVESAPCLARTLLVWSISCLQQRDDSLGIRKSMKRLPIRSVVGESSFSL